MYKSGKGGGGVTRFFVVALIESEREGARVY